MHLSNNISISAMGYKDQRKPQNFSFLKPGAFLHSDEVSRSRLSPSIDADYTFFAVLGWSFDLIYPYNVSEQLRPSETWR
jgi:hypothetical protein